MTERWRRLSADMRARPVARGLLRALLSARAAALGMLGAAAAEAAVQQHELSESVALERWKLSQVVCKRAARLARAHGPAPPGAAGVWERWPEQWGGHRCRLRRLRC